MQAQASTDRNTSKKLNLKKESEKFHRNGRWVDISKEERNLRRAQSMFNKPGEVLFGRNIYDSQRLRDKF